MTRVVPKPANRGSQKWLQTAVNEKRAILNSAILQQFTEANHQTIEWLSPIKSDDYAEYKDNNFLQRLNINLSDRSLVSFWPQRGPQWDGLAKIENEKILLIEAKSHLLEMQSPATRASKPSRNLIQESLIETKSFLGVQSETDWAGMYYQYTNRIAHLYLLRELNNIPVYLVFLCFINDKEMKGPTTIEEWQASIHKLETHLGLPAVHKLSDYIMHIYLDISLLQ